MNFIYKSNESQQASRAHVIAYIKEKKRQNPAFRVIDIGGGLNPWANEVVDAYVDVHNPNNSKNVFVGDINESEVWESIAKDGGTFDFSICTHTLEDIRDPIFVLKEIQKVSKAGYISFPNKHTEFSNHQSHYWTGSCHHRWVYTIKTDAQGDKLFFMPIWPGAMYFNGEHQSPLVFLKRLFRLTNKDKNHGSRRLPWWNAQLKSDKNELGFIWQDKIAFEYVDYMSPTRSMVDDYRTLLADGL